MYITFQHDATDVHDETTLWKTCTSVCNIVQLKITCTIIETIMRNMCTHATLYVYVENNEHYMLHHVALCSLTCTWRNYIEQHVYIRWHCVLTCGYVVFLSNNIVQHVTIMHTLLHDYDDNHHDTIICRNVCTSIANMF